MTGTLMRIFVGSAVSLAALFLWTSVFHQRALSQLPTGYKRHQFQGIAASFPCPDGWFIRERLEKGCIAGYLTKQDTLKEGMFETGLTINFMRDVSDSAARKASEYAAAYGRMATTERKELLPVLQSEDQGCQRFTFRVTGEGITVHYVLIADDQHNTLHLMFFESPDEEWEVAWKLGEVMLLHAEIDFAKAAMP